MTQRVSIRLIGLMVLNIGLGCLYVATPYLIPELTFMGELLEPARGLTGFSLLIISIAILIAAVIHWVSMTPLKEAECSTLAATLGLLGHGLSFFRVGFLAGVPSLILSFVCGALFFRLWRNHSRCFDKKEAIK